MAMQNNIFKALTLVGLHLLTNNCDNFTGCPAKVMINSTKSGRIRYFNKDTSGTYKDAIYPTVVSLSFSSS
jgi:hypothetical protein